MPAESEDGLNEASAEQIAQLRESALRLLARREHTRLELAHKLSRRDFARSLIEPLLDQLIAENLLSDARFAEVYTSARADKGYGPLRLRAELRERGVSDELVSEALAPLAEYWQRGLQRLAQRRFDFSDGVPDIAERAKQTRFLRQRGFTLQQIGVFYKSL